MDDTEHRINLKTLKKVDPYIVSIEDHSSQVALYKFQGKSREWEKTAVEGTLFVYKREAEPQYGFTILNRSSMENLVEPVTKELDFQLQAPFLLYRNHQGDIFGIWFYEQSVCERVGSKIVSLVKEAEKKMTCPKAGTGDLNALFRKAGREKTPEKPQTDTSGQNLLRLLGGSKETTEVNTAKHTEEKEAVETTASVADFFALAKADPLIIGEGAGQGQVIPGSSSAFSSVPMMVGATVPVDVAVPRAAYTTPTVTAMPISQGLAMGAVPVPISQGLGAVPVGGHMGSVPIRSHISPVPSLNPVFERLLSNPGAHSVESLERQQRSSVSPVSETHPPLTATPNMTNLESDLKAKLHIGGLRKSSHPGEAGVQHLVASHQGQGDASVQHMMGSNQGEAGLHHHLGSHQEEASVQHLLGSQPGLIPITEGMISVRSVEQLNSVLPVSLGFPGLTNAYSPSHPVPAYAPPHPLPAFPHHTYAPVTSQPTLLSPHVFTARSTESPSPSRLCNGSSPSEKKASTVSPLTKAQMLQALQHLLDTDDEFVSKLHEAYVHSLNTKFNIV